MSLVTREMAAPNGQDLVHINGNSNHQQALSPTSTNENNIITPRNGPFADDDMSREYNPPPSSFSAIPKQNGNGVMGSNSSGLADFYSSEVFQIVLHNPATAHRLLKFSQARMCGENMEFLEKVHRLVCARNNPADQHFYYAG